MVVTTEENIKVVGEIGDVKVIIAPCTWATANRLQSCTGYHPCRNYVYGTVTGTKKPYIIGWCHDAKIIIQRAESWVRMLEYRHKSEIASAEARRKIEELNKPEKGYL